MVAWRPAEGLRGPGGARQGSSLTVVDLSLGRLRNEDKLKTILARRRLPRPSDWEHRERRSRRRQRLANSPTGSRKQSGSAVTRRLLGQVGGAGARQSAVLRPQYRSTAAAGPMGFVAGLEMGSAGSVCRGCRGNQGRRKALQDGTLTVDPFRSQAYRRHQQLAPGRSWRKSGRVRNPVGQGDAISVGLRQGDGRGRPGRCLPGPAEPQRAARRGRRKQDITEAMNVGGG